MANPAFRNLLVVLRTMLGLTFLFLGVSSGRAQGTVVVGFDTPRGAVFHVGGPVYFDTKIQNYSSDTVKVNMGYHGKWNFEFTLVNPDGTTVDVPPYRKFGPGPRSTFVVEPSHTRARRMVFNDWYTFTRPGEYKLKVRLTVLLSSSANVSWQKEFFDDLKIIVEPYDAEKLKATCEKLAETAMGTNDAEAAAVASLALSYVADAVAIPFQARILKEGLPEARTNAVMGLTRIGNREAREALRAGLETADAELRTQIESALHQFPPGT